MSNRPQVNKYKKSVVLTKTKSVLFPSAEYINTETARLTLSDRQSEGDQGKQGQCKLYTRFHLSGQKTAYFSSYFLDGCFVRIGPRMTFVKEGDTSAQWFRSWTNNVSQNNNNNVLNLKNNVYFWKIMSQKAHNRDISWFATKERIWPIWIREGRRLRSRLRLKLDLVLTPSYTDRVVWMVTTLKRLLTWLTL